MISFDAEKVESIMTVSLMEFAIVGVGGVSSSILPYLSAGHVSTCSLSKKVFCLTCLAVCFRYWLYVAPQRNSEVHKEDDYF